MQTKPRSFNKDEFEKTEEKKKLKNYEIMIMNMQIHVFLRQ